MIILSVPPPPDSILYSGSFCGQSKQKRSPERLRMLRASFFHKVGQTCFVSSVRVEMLNSTKPMTNRMAMEPTPTLALPVS